MYPEDFETLLLSNKAQFESLPPKIQVAYCINLLEAQVNNGGFHQFFFNLSGEYVRETVAALERIRAPITQALLERPVALAYPGGYPLDAGDHQEALGDHDDVADALRTLDDEFFGYPEPLADLVNAYLAAARDP